MYSNVSVRSFSWSCPLRQRLSLDCISAMILIRYEMENTNSNTGTTNNNVNKCNTDIRFTMINDMIYVNNLLPAIIQSLREDASVYTISIGFHSCILTNSGTDSILVVSLEWVKYHEKMKEEKENTYHPLRRFTISCTLQLQIVCVYIHMYMVASYLL